MERKNKAHWKPMERKMEVHGTRKTQQQRRASTPGRGRRSFLVTGDGSTTLQNEDRWCRWRSPLWQQVTDVDAAWRREGKKRERKERKIGGRDGDPEKKRRDDDASKCSAIWRREMKRPKGRRRQGHRRKEEKLSPIGYYMALINHKKKINK